MMIYYNKTFKETNIFIIDEKYSSKMKLTIEYRVRYYAIFVKMAIEKNIQAQVIYITGKSTDTDFLEPIESAFKSIELRYKEKNKSSKVVNREDLCEQFIKKIMSNNYLYKKIYKSIFKEEGL